MAHSSRKQHFGSWYLCWWVVVLIHSSLAIYTILQGFSETDPPSHLIFRFLLGSLADHLPYSAITYPQSLKPTTPPTGRYIKWWNITAGLFAGVTEAVAVVGPMEVVKIRLQAQHHSMSDPMDVPKYRNAGHALLVILREEGVKTLYRCALSLSPHTECKLLFFFFLPLCDYGVIVRWNLGLFVCESRGVGLTALRQATNQGKHYFTGFQSFPFSEVLCTSPCLLSLFISSFFHSWTNEWLCINSRQFHRLYRVETPFVRRSTSIWRKRFTFLADCYYRFNLWCLWSFYKWWVSGHSLPDGCTDYVLFKKRKREWHILCSWEIRWLTPCDYLSCSRRPNE